MTARPVVLVAAAAMIDTDGRVLVAKRPEGKSMAGLWEFPGGKVAEGESPETALVRELAELAREGSINAAAAGFHHALVRGAARVCEEIGKESGTRRAALAGGVFMNRILRDGLTEALVNRGFEVYIGEKIPPHDGGLSLGQAGVAMAKGVG